MKLEKREISLWISGFGLLSCVAGWSLLSHRFVFGQGHADRPILLFLCLFLLAWLFYVFAAVRISRTGGRGPLLLILAVGAAARLILLPSELIQENDVYRYVLDGQVVLQGGNPYQHSPWDRLQQTAADEPDVDLGSEAARKVLSRISYPQIPTIYPPLAEAVFAGGATIGGWQWQGQRLILLLVDSLTLAGLLFLMGLLGIRPGWIVLYAWNPLLIKEVANSAHIDVLVALCLVGLLLGLALFQISGRSLWLILGGLALAGAVLAKLHPLLLLPAVLLFLWRRRQSLQDLAVLGLVCGATILAGYAPFLGIGVPQIFRGLQIYAGDWRMNEGFFSLLAWVSAQPRAWATFLVGAGALLLPWVSPARRIEGLARHFQWVLLVWFLVMPSPFPWYAIPLVMLRVVSDSRAANAATLVLSGVGGLYYLRFFIEYQELSDSWWVAARTLEHAAVWLTILWVYGTERLPKRSRSSAETVR